MRFHLSMLRPPPFPPGTLYTISLVLVTVAVAILAWIAYDAWRERRRRIEDLKRRAADVADEKGLTPEEADLLERIMIAEGAYPGPRGFERNVEVFLERKVPPEMIGSLRLKLGFHRARVGRPLVSTRECEAGQDLTLTDAENVWKAAVLDLDETVLTLKVPAEAARVLHPGSIVKASFWRDLDARYFFQTTVKAARLRPAPLVHVLHPAEIERHQDREHVRVGVDWTLSAVRLTEEEARRLLRGPLYAEAIEGTTMEVRVVDISAGGLRLAAPIRPGGEAPAGFNVHDHFVVPIPSSERKDPLLVIARVVAADEKAVRCEFVGLSMNERDEIHREILRERRRQKRRF